MRRAPAKPVRACILRKWCPGAHVAFEAPLRTSHLTRLTALFTLHTALFALHVALFALRTSHSTLHTSQSALHTSSHFSLLSSHPTTQTSHSTLHTAFFTPHTSHCNLHTPHSISSELFSPYSSSSLLISSLLICHLSFHESLPSTTTKELACAVRQPGPCVRALCEAVAVLLSKNMTCARPRCNAQSTSQYCCVLQSLHKLLPSTTVHYKACTNYFPVLLCTTKLAQTTSQYYFVLQSLQKALPSDRTVDVLSVRPPKRWTLDLLSIRPKRWTTDLLSIWPL